MYLSRVGQVSGYPPNAGPQGHLPCVRFNQGPYPPWRSTLAGEPSRHTVDPPWRQGRLINVLEQKEPVRSERHGRTRSSINKVSHLAVILPVIFKESTISGDLPSPLKPSYTRSGSFIILTKELHGRRTD